MKSKVFISILIVVVAIPQIAFATWWNPFSWFNGWTFQKNQAPVVEEIQKTPEEKPTEDEKKIVEPAPNPKPKSTPAPAPTPTQKAPIKPSTIPQKNTQQELNELVSVFKNILETNKNDIDSFYETGKKIATYPSVYQSEIMIALAKLDSLIEDMYEFGRDILSEVEKMQKAQSIDFNYWKTVGIPNMLIKQKEFKERGLKIMNNFIEDIDNARAQNNLYYSSQNNYHDACDEIEQELRDSISSGGGFATESQIQAMLQAKDCY